MTLYGPDGRPLGVPSISVTADGTATYQAGEEKASASPEELLMAMARAERDGMNHRQLIAEFGLMGLATSPFYLNRALARGHQLLNQAIAAGREPEHTVRRHAVDEIAPGEDDA